ncbi:MAG: hypothetical protein ACI9TK_000513 [Flavobacteriaceae bacterium]|jgi:hypothetical protein
MYFKRVFITLLVITSCTTKKNNTLDLLDCVPQNSVVTFLLNDQNMLKNALNNLTFLTDILAVDSVLYKNVSAIIPKEISQNALLSFTPLGKSEFALSFVYKPTLKDSIPEIDSKKINYNNVPISIYNRELTKMFSAIIEGVRIISTSKLVLENSIRNIQNNLTGIQNHYYFDLAKISDVNAPMNILIHQDVKELLRRFFPETPLFPFLGSSWFLFDFNTKKNPFTLDGVSFLNDSIPDELNLLNGTGKRPLLSTKYVPQNFDSYLALAIDDYKALEENFKKFSRYKNIALSGINFDPLSNVDEIGLLQLNTKKALFFHLNNSENINPLLFSKDKIATLFRGAQIYIINLPTDILAFLGAYGTTKMPKWAVQIDDFIIMSEDESFLKQIIGVHLDGKTLSNDLNFKTMQEGLADSSSFLWIGRTENLKNLWHKGLKKKSVAWKKIELKKYPLLVLQGVYEDGFVQTRLTAQINSINQNKNSVTNKYKFSLDAAAGRVPQWIKNHRNKTMDIVIQDQDNVLYLFSNKGTLYWKKQLNGPIIGDIDQVDLFKNRKLQMAFRTANRFMILDRNGNIVSPFDIKIPDSSPQHFATFDYDLNRNYRFFLTHGKQIQIFDNKGKKVTGFKLKKLNQPLQNPPKHIRFKTKDYIVLQDIDGQVRILDRQGKERITLKNKANTSSNPIFEYRNTFATTNKQGDLIQIDSRGNVVASDLKLRPGHFIDMTSKSLVSFSENILRIKGIPVELPFGKYTAPKIHYINNIIYISISDLDTQKVYVFYGNGIALSGFPVYGSSAVDIANADDDKALEMVVQSEANSFLIYKIN